MINSEALSNMYPDSIGGAISTTAGTLGEIAQNEHDASMERIRSCEKNQETYRRMLESSQYDFEQMCEIRTWIEKEQQRQGEINEEHHAREREVACTVAAVCAVSVVAAIAVVNPDLAKSLAKRIPSLLPKALKYLNAA